MAIATNAAQPKPESGFVFCKYVVRNGKTIYPKKAKVFRIPLSSFKKRKS